MKRPTFGLDTPVERKPIRDRESITIDLPFPPSVNNLFANGTSGRYATQPYRDWQAAAGKKVIIERPGRVPGAVKLTLVFEERSGRRDLDNLQKAPIDLLVKHNIIDGDHRTVVREIHAAWGNVQGVRITITPAVKVAA